MSASIVQTMKSPCEVEHCDRTLQCREYGYASEGDVRRCPHGKIWVATGRERTGRYYNTLDCWRELHPFWNRRHYTEAVQALEAEDRKDV